VRIRIDADRCSGHGRCYALTPQLFSDDERGYGQVIGDGTVGEGELSAAERAVVACPERAIILDET